MSIWRSEGNMAKGREVVVSAGCTVEGKEVDAL
jgi:hypothetical protein